MASLGWPSRISDLAREAVRRGREALASPARFLTDADREAIEAEIHGAGGLTNAYGFLLFSACGIAALGLLQSSVAVVIGAMLISPLMGPILSMGLALARVEPRAFKSAAVTLAVGAALSVAASTLIVWAAPLKDLTPEILARTRPTLLDLAVAILSGFVGAYLTINRKGAAIAGVAIATALMPPLAVVGYGLATQTWTVAGGAGLLFLTNVVAILGSVFGVARRYGFRPAARTGAAWEAPALLAVIIVLCVPLGLSLRNIVIEARETTRVRGAIAEAFSGARPHITDLQVEMKRGAPSDVQCVVVTRRYVPGAAEAVARGLGGHAQVVIEQVVAADGVPKPDPSGGALANRAMTSAVAVAEATPSERMRAMLSAVGRVQAVETTDDGLQVTVLLNGEPKLSDYQALEDAAQRMTPGTTVRIRPPLMPLPDVAFARGSSRLDAAADAAVATAAWAISRWNAPAVEVEGDASPNRRGRRAADVRLAQARADAVAARLRELGVAEVRTTTLVPERLEGDEARYLLARVRLVATPVATPVAAAVDEEG
ncbi:MAG: DUF389 domain-containing protein [Phenylobacterium sp.]|uniref:DUF389 domain-containing protein n=1 Tax=Phenylobacterium sp. TaxID=1871053 RepID=UPI0025DF46F2|nr:DUF389 domain-containing protein [Phenylobacterium sp.]MBI1197115.1 DUF389 domain-containing protein [Phenylobacterium sp.]